MRSRPRLRKTAGSSAIAPAHLVQCSFHRTGTVCPMMVMNGCFTGGINETQNTVAGRGGDYGICLVPGGLPAGAQVHPPPLSTSVKEIDDVQSLESYRGHGGPFASR